jgi:hypothetical protein
MLLMVVVFSKGSESHGGRLRGDVRTNGLPPEQVFHAHPTVGY